MSINNHTQQVNLLDLLKNAVNVNNLHKTEVGRMSQKALGLPG